MVVIHGAFLRGRHTDDDEGGVFAEGGCLCMIGEEAGGDGLHNGGGAEVFGGEELEDELVGFEAFGAVDTGEDGGFSEHLLGEGVVGAALPGGLGVLGYDLESGRCESWYQLWMGGETNLSRSSTWAL